NYFRAAICESEWAGDDVHQWRAACKDFYGKSGVYGISSDKAIAFTKVYDGRPNDAILSILELAEQPNRYFQWAGLWIRVAEMSVVPGWLGAGMWIADPAAAVAD